MSYSVMGLGVDAFPGLGIPGFPSLAGGVQLVDGLNVVNPSVKALLDSALGAVTASQDAAALKTAGLPAATSTTEWGILIPYNPFVVTENAWAKTARMKGLGYATLIDTAASLAVRILFTKDPALVAQYAKPGGQFAIYDGDAGVIAAAKTGGAGAAGGGQPAAQGCPSGQNGFPPFCFPACPSGQVGTPPLCVGGASPVPAPGGSTTGCPSNTVGIPPICLPMPGAQQPCPAPYSGTSPNCVPPPCPANTTGQWPNCVPSKCPDGQTGTPPDCKSSTNIWMYVAIGVGVLAVGGGIAAVAMRKRRPATYSGPAPASLPQRATPNRARRGGANRCYC